MYFTISDLGVNDFDESVIVENDLEFALFKVFSFAVSYCNELTGLGSVGKKSEYHTVLAQKFRRYYEELDRAFAPDGVILEDYRELLSVRFHEANEFISHSDESPMYYRKIAYFYFSQFTSATTSDAKQMRPRRSKII